MNKRASFFAVNVTRVWATVTVGLMLTFAVVVNSFIPNRAIHRGRVAAMMVMGSAGAAWARRRGVI